MEKIIETEREHAVEVIEVKSEKSIFSFLKPKVEPITKNDVNMSILIKEVEPLIIEKFGLDITSNEVPVFNQITGYSEDELQKVNQN